MKASDIPTKISTAFGVSAGGSYIRAIPLTSVDPNAASFTLGFPPNNFVPEPSGGVPPNGKDFNGILFAGTSWNRWQCAGAVVLWDFAYSSVVGGYPKGAMLANATTVGRFWISAVDDNTTNPDAGGANWIGFGAGDKVTTVTASTALTTAVAGLVLIDATLADVLVTLPAANANSLGGIVFKFVRIDSTSHAVTIQAAGSDSIDSGAVVLGGNASYRSLETNNINKWYSVGGLQSFTTYAGNPNGHIAGTAGIPGVSPPSTVWDSTDNIVWVCTTSGVAASAVWVPATGGSITGDATEWSMRIGPAILKGGTLDSTDVTGTVTFAVPFPNNLLSVIAFNLGNDPWWNVCADYPGGTGATVTGFDWYSQNVGGGANQFPLHWGWLAVGN